MTLLAWGSKTLVRMCRWMLTLTPTAGWDKSHTQGGLKKCPATAISSGDGTMTECPGPVQLLVAKGLRLQAPLQPSTVHRLVHCYWDTSKG